MFYRFFVSLLVVIAQNSLADSEQAPPHPDEVRAEEAKDESLSVKKDQLLCVSLTVQNSLATTSLQPNETVAEKAENEELPVENGTSHAFGMAGPNPWADLPSGTYIYDLAPDLTDTKESVEKMVKITSDDSGGRTLTLTRNEKESSIKEVDKYLDLGFDIVLAGDSLALIPAKIKHVVKFLPELSMDDASYEQLMPWIFDRDLSLPETCDLKLTKYIENNELLITYCKKHGGIELQRNILTSFKPGYYENLANLDGALSYTNDAIDKDGCKAVGGRIERINNGLGTAICNGSVNANLNLPEGISVAGYDVLHDVLYAHKSVMPEYLKDYMRWDCDTLIGNQQLYKNSEGRQMLLESCYKQYKNKDHVSAKVVEYELVSPKKCIDEGLKIEVVSDQLVCVQ